MELESYQDSLENLTKVAVSELLQTTSPEEVSVWRSEYLGRSGKLTSILRSLGSMHVDVRREVGIIANIAKSDLENAMSEKLEDLDLSNSNSLSLDRIDITLPGRPVTLGRFHPSTKIIREISNIFKGLGFQIIEGPEVEWDRYNFEMLNIPKDHPARDMFDTFWLDENRDETGGLTPLLRTLTSPMQARIMESQDPPIRVIVPGKVYRYEATDASHESQFHQVEGLVVDRGITFGNLKHTIFEFAKRLFGEDRNIRFRCDYFPFVEPGVDVSVDCFKCESNDPGCPVCKGSGWIEIMGAGMVHPNVLESAGYDPNVYTGFAFGMGPERIAMLKYGIEDVRYFLGNDLRFLSQF